MQKRHKWVTKSLLKYTFTWNTKRWYTLFLYLQYALIKISRSQGRIREEVVYGICLPLSGFSALFVIVSLSAVISALVAGAMVHRLQAQRELARNTLKSLPAALRRTEPHQHQQQHHQVGWLQAYGLFRARCILDNRQRPQPIDGTGKWAARGWGLERKSKPSNVRVLCGAYSFIDYVLGDENFCIFGRGFVECVEVYSR